MARNRAAAPTTTTTPSETKKGPAAAASPPPAAPAAASSFSDKEFALSQTDSTLRFCTVAPTTSDWAYSGAILLVGVVYAWYSNFGLFPAGVLIVASFAYLSLSVIDYTFITTIDKTRNRVSVAKYWLGRLHSERVCNANELVQVYVQEDEISKRSKGWVMEMEFMASHGYVRLRVADTLLVGERNRGRLLFLKAKIDAFMELRQNPFTEGGAIPKRTRQEQSGKKY
ncbi:hypothetical protein DFJ73DRAFT_824182 [Zopfochytrium polystomum]|nr:hypothetical protein DFJ73DRAFT_824182 [Zopfochytrium polystomum]